MLPRDGARPRTDEADRLTSEARRAQRADSSLRDLLGRHPDPLLVELLIGAVVLDLSQGLVDGIDERTVFGERYPVLLARRDGFDEPDLLAALYDLPVRGREVVDPPLDLPYLQRHEGLPYGSVTHDLPYLLAVAELFGLDLAH